MIATYTIHLHFQQPCEEVLGSSLLGRLTGKLQQGLAQLSSSKPPGLEMLTHSLQLWGEGEGKVTQYSGSLTDRRDECGISTAPIII